MMKALVFDLDNTLYLRAEPFRRALQACFEELLQDRDLSEAVHDIYRKSRIHWEEAYADRIAGKTDMREMQRQRIGRTLQEFGIIISDEEADLFENYYEEFQKQICLVPEMNQILDWGKKQGVRMGILSNGPSRQQRRKLEALDIRQWIPEEYVLISGETGFSKPSAEMFRLFEKRSGIKANDIWYVGDSYENDILGANGAGWHSIWIRRAEDPDPFSDTDTEKERNIGVKADLETYDEREIFHFLKGSFDAVKGYLN